MKSKKSRFSFKKCFSVLAIIIFLTLTVLWLARHKIANSMMSDAIEQVSTKSQKLGVELVGINTGEIEITSPMEARSQHVSTDFDIGIPNKDKIRSRFEAQNVEVTAAGIFPPKVRVRVQDFTLKFHPEDVPEGFPFDGFKSGSFLSAPLPATNLDSALQQSTSRLKSLFQENEVDADFNFSGYVSIATGGDDVVDALLYTEKLENGKRSLRFKQDDLKKIVEKSKLRVSDAMLDILSEYPLRAPVIMLVSNKAKKEAADKKKRDANFPDDAYRHITWSYQLTKVFGPEFAKRVTDSHETLDGNTPDERAMDYHNNAVARELVAQGVEETALVRIVLEDPRVIRQPDDVSKMKVLKK